MVPGTWQASVCDEQLMSIGGGDCMCLRSLRGPSFPSTGLFHFSRPLNSQRSKRSLGSFRQGSLPFPSPLKGYGIMPLCHFHSSFEVCRIWFPTSLHDESLCFSVPSSLLRPLNQYHTIFPAPSLLPRPTSPSHCGACLFTLR